MAGFYHDLEAMTQAFHGLQRADETDMQAEERVKHTNGGSHNNGNSNASTNKDGNGRKRG